MKKMLGLMLAAVVLFSLSGCGSSPSKDLQSQTWDFVNGLDIAGTMDFKENTVIVQFGFLKRGFEYKISKDNIQLVQADKTLNYKISKNSDGYTFIAADENTKNDGGDLTLMR